MYKIASEKAQRGRERVRVADLSGKGAPELISAADRIRDLSRAVDNIEIQILEAKKADPPDKIQLKMLGLRKLEIQNQIKAAKSLQSPNIKRLPQFFIEVAEELLPGEMFEAIKSEAQLRCHRAYDDAK